MVNISCGYRQSLQNSDGALLIAIRARERKVRGFLSTPILETPHASWGGRDRGAYRAVQLHLLVNQSVEEEERRMVSFPVYFPFFLFGMVLSRLGSELVRFNNVRDCRAT